MKANSPTLNRLNKNLGAPSIFALAAVALLLSSPGSQAQQEPNRQLVQTGSLHAGSARRIALVLGNGAYTGAPTLKNPPNDARDMAATLKALGFEVSSGVNLSQREMKRLIREFGQKLKAGGNGLFYYAGHGVQARGRNFIIPVDADIQSEADVEDSGVDVGLVLNYMDDAQNGLNIVILDACRNNPFGRSFRSATEGLAQVDAPTGTLIAYATAPGRVAADGVGQNGLYTSELLKAMRLPGLSVTDMFMQVRAEVMKKTGNKQVPWEASSLVGSFYFSGGAGNAVPSETKFDAAAFEYSYWETIKNSTDADDFKAYIAKYPDGQFASLAKNRISNLEATGKPSESRVASDDSSPTELAFWDSIEDSINPDDFKLYIKKFPEGAFVDLANSRINSLSGESKEKANAAARPMEPEHVKQFEVKNGLSAFDTRGILFISASSIYFVAADDPDKNKLTFACSEIKEAKTLGIWYNNRSFRIRVGNKNHDFRASTGDEAKVIVDAVRSECKLSRK